MIADTNALVALLTRPDSLPGGVLQIMSNGNIALKASASSLYEVAAAHRCGVLLFNAKQFENELRNQNIDVLPTSHDQMRIAGEYQINNPGPWTRLVAAQAQTENLPVISENPTYDKIGVQRIWL